LGFEEQPQYPCRFSGRVAPSGDRLGGEQDGGALLQGVGGCLTKLEFQRDLQDAQQLGPLGFEGRRPLLLAAKVSSCTLGGLSRGGVEVQDDLGDVGQLGSER
jgi:hypothetical protein